MKRIFMILVTSAILFGCTEQQRVKNFGGKQTVNLPKGEKLLMATWKEDNLFYLTEPMDADYIPKTKTFKECSSFGMLESTVYFVENK